MCFASLLFSGVDRRGIKMSVYNYTALENKFLDRAQASQPEGKIQYLQRCRKHEK